MKTTAPDIRSNYPCLNFGSIPERRLFGILHRVLTMNELPEDITSQEKGCLQYQLIEPYIDADGSYSYYLTDFGGNYDQAQPPPPVCSRLGRASVASSPWLTV